MNDDYLIALPGLSEKLDSIDEGLRILDYLSRGPRLPWERNRLSRWQAPQYRLLAVLYLADKLRAKGVRVHYSFVTGQDDSGVYNLAP